MSYRALYRVWRPQRFDEIVGQPVITRTLKNALITGQISHAYLFTGPRGTGKTSAAKIFAKAVNCPNLKDGEPCNHCRICKAITQGKLDDVIEIDAASNNGVDEIRNVRDKVKYAPTQAKYKVYIIDEVHMLSIGAFNALLKTLEEPPAHVIFIMATTEPQKIPATIISRTQRFNFRRIKPTDLLNQMEFILKHEQVKYDPRALKVIARAAEGGMRDALSILDEVMSYGKDRVSYTDALRITGSVTHDLLSKYLTSVVNHDVQSALIDVQKILMAGRDANQFIEQLIDYCQALLLYRQSHQLVKSNELGLIDDHFKQLAKQVSTNLINSIIFCVNQVQEQMQLTTHPDVYLEVLTVKIATLKPKVSESAVNNRVSALIKKVDQLQHTVQDLKSRKPVAQVPTSPRTPAQSSAELKPLSSSPNHYRPVHVNLTRIDSILNRATSADLSNIRNAWREVVNQLPVTGRAIMCKSSPVAASPNGVVITLPYHFVYRRVSNNQSLIKELVSNLGQIVGKLPKLALLPSDDWTQIRSNYYQHHFDRVKSTNSRPSAKKSTASNDSPQRRDIMKKVSDRLGSDAQKIVKIKND